jgi:hypothetical protein
MYIYIASDTSTHLFTGNKPASFIYKLPKTIRFFDSNVWEVSLLDLKTPDFLQGYLGESITLMVDICDMSMYGNEMRPVLARVNRNPKSPSGISFIPHTDRYVTVTRETIEYINLYLCDELGREPSFTDGVLRCTLHLRPRYKT